MPEPFSPHAALPLQPDRLAERYALEDGELCTPTLNPSHFGRMPKPADFNAKAFWCAKDKFLGLHESLPLGRATLNEE